MFKKVITPFEGLKPKSVKKAKIPITLTQRENE
jgi:hypothetical protein